MPRETHSLSKSPRHTASLRFPPAACPPARSQPWVSPLSLPVSLPSADSPTVDDVAAAVWEEKKEKEVYNDLLTSENKKEGGRFLRTPLRLLLFGGE
jgi:hypothetical protein